MKERKEQIVKLAKFLSFSIKSERRPRASISENFLPFAGGGVFGKKSAIAAPIRASAEAQQSGSSVESNFSKPKSETAASETSAELASLSSRTFSQAQILNFCSAPWQARLRAPKWECTQTWQLAERQTKARDSPSRPLQKGPGQRARTRRPKPSAHRKICRQTFLSEGKSCSRRGLWKVSATSLRRSCLGRPGKRQTAAIKRQTSRIR